MPAVVAHHPLRLAGGAGGVEDVEGIGGRDRHALVRLGPGKEVAPVEVAGRVEGASVLGALEDDAPVRAVARELDRPVEERLVLDDAPRLDAARGAEDHLRLAVVDAPRELLRREPAEDDAVHRPEAGAGEHRDDRLGHHRHVDDDPVAAPDPEPGERPGAARGLVLELGVGEARLPTGDGAVVDDGRLLAAARLDMHIDRVVAGVDLGSREPAVERRPPVVEHPIPAAVPRDGLRRLSPEPLGVAEGTLEDGVESAAHGLSPRSFARLAKDNAFAAAGERLALPQFIHRAFTAWRQPAHRSTTIYGVE